MTETEIPAKRSRRPMILSALLILVLPPAVLWFSFYTVPAVEGLPGLLAKQAQIKELSKLKLFPKQGKNECGAYSVSLGFQLKTGVAVDPKAMVGKVSQQLSWSEALSGTLPWKLQEEAKKRGLSDKCYTASKWTAEQRVELLKSHVVNNNPVVVLIESERGHQHYVLLVGFSEKTLYFYDPNIAATAATPDRTKDLNGPLPGNHSLSEAQFLTLWGQGGLIGLYKWWYLPIKTEN
jgi:predicted double-glycine peptidase